MKCPNEVDVYGCHLFSCRHHLMHTEAVRAASVKGAPEQRHADRVLLDKLQASDYTCSLEVVREYALNGGANGEEIAQIIGMSRERVRQISDRAVDRLMLRVLSHDEHAPLYDDVKRHKFRERLNSRMVEIDEKLAESAKHPTGVQRLLIERRRLSDARVIAERKGIA